MASKTKTGDFSSYRLEGNPVETTPIIGNLINNELGAYILERLNSKFKGTRLAYPPNEMPQEGQPIKFSNFPRILDINQELRQLPDINIRPLTAREAVTYFNAKTKEGKLVIPERDKTYADTISVLIAPKEGRNEAHENRIMGILGISRLEEPLVVNGLGVAPADNGDGFIFEETDGITTEPYQAILELAKSKGVAVRQSLEQSGLRRLFRNQGRLSARDDRLLIAKGSGRVQVIQDPKDPRTDLELVDRVLQEVRRGFTK
ncbi:MAG: hypothetical protein Q8Q42_01695 [Nanoarchaeota archaeon]|nr:hypothetical protein [Nanoarchaeota archaeon]